MPSGLAPQTTTTVTIPMPPDGGTPGGVTPPVTTTVTVSPESSPPPGITPPTSVTVTVTAETDGGTPTTDVTTADGAIVIAKVDPAGAPVGNACFDVVSGEEPVASVCDDGDGDAAEGQGTIRIQIAEGAYTLRETPPAEYVAAEDVPVTVVAGTDSSIQILNARIATPATVPATINAVVLISFADEAGVAVPNGCVELRGPLTFPACDNGDGDADQTVGTIEIDFVGAGDYTVVQTKAPEGYELTAEPGLLQVTIEDFYTVPLTYRAATTTATTGAVQINKIDAGDGITLLPGSCFDLVGEQTYTRCDDQPDDADELVGADAAPGVIVIADVVPGVYTLRETTPPPGYEAAGFEQTVMVEAGQTAPATVPNAAVATTASLATLRVTVLDDQNQAIPGACVSLTPLGEGQGDARRLCDGDETDGTSDGVVTFTDLVAGTYELSQEPIADFQPVEPKQVAIPDGGGTVEEQFVNAPVSQSGSLTVTTVDPDGNPVPNVCYEVAGIEGQPCDDDGDGQQPFEGLAPGEYTVRQISVPEGFVLADPPEQTATVEAGVASPVQFTSARSAPQVGSLTITTLDPDGNLVPNVCYEVVGVEGQRCDDDGDGQQPIEELAPGEYSVRQVSVPEGYVLADPAEQTATVESGAAAPVQFSSPRSAPRVGGLAISTTGPDGSLLPNVCYEVVGVDGQQCDDDGDGIVPLTELAVGAFTVRQVSVPEGYDLDAAPEQQVTVEPDQTLDVRFTSQLSAPTTGSVQILLLDDQNQPRPGACFDLTGPQSIQVCDNDTTDTDGADGTILVPNLLPGEYTVTETQTPAGLKSAEPQIVPVVAGPDFATVTFVNLPEPTGVALTSPVVFDDDVGRLWLLRPNDPQPTRLDSDDRPFDRSMDPVISDDGTWVAFLINNPDAPAANMVWIKVEDLASGTVDFANIGTPRRIVWLPGRNDALAIVVEQPTGTTNIFFHVVGTSDISAPVFAPGEEPVSVDALAPAPAGSLLAIQVTDAGGDPDTYVVNTADFAAPAKVIAGPNGGNDPDFFAGWRSGGDRFLLRSGVDQQLLYAVDGGGVATPLGDAPVFSGDPLSNTSPQWSADGGLAAYFDGDPGAGAGLHLVGADGPRRCDPLGEIAAFAWSPADGRLWMLVRPPEGPIRLVALDADCGQQEITTFDADVDRLSWAPNGSALAVVDRSDGGTTVWLVRDGQPTQVDPAPVNVAITDIFDWSPGGDMLAVYAGGPTVSLWVVTPGSPAPTAVLGSTLTEGASFVTHAWWI